MSKNCRITSGATKRWFRPTVNGAGCTPPSIQSRTTLLHAHCYSRQTTAIAGIFVQELSEKCDGEDAECLGDGAPWFRPRWTDAGFDFTTSSAEIGPLSNAFIE